MNQAELPTSPDGTDWGIYGDTPNEQWKGIMFEAERQNENTNYFYEVSEESITRLESHIKVQARQVAFFRNTSIDQAVQITRLQVENQELGDQVDVFSMSIKCQPSMKDITAPKHGVQVQIRADGTVLWVHADGVTLLRICQIPRLEIVDDR